MTLYTPGYKYKDIPEYLWDSSADIKSCLPRIVRLALFSRGSGVYDNERSSAVLMYLIALILSIRVIFHCIISFVTNLMWSLLPQVIQRARGGRTAVTTSISTSIKLLDVLITFDSSPATLPHILLSPFAKKIISFRSGPRDTNDCLFSKWFSCRQPDQFIVTSDSDSLSSFYQPVTIYPPVVVLDKFANPHLLPDKTNRPYFIALSWYKKHFTDIFVAIESFSVFLKSFTDALPENDDEDGCTGSLSIPHDSLARPYLVIADVCPQDVSSIVAEISRLRLGLDEDVILVLSQESKDIASLVDASIGVIHTPTEVNEVGIACAGMLSGKPVVTTMSFCQSEPVRHESTGVLVKTASPHLVAQGIDHIYTLYMSRTAEWVRMGQRGKQRVLTEYSIEMFGSRLDDVIESQGPPSSGSLRPRAFSTGSAAGSERGGRTLSVQSGLSELVAAASTTD